MDLIAYQRGQCGCSSPSSKVLYANIKRKTYADFRRNENLLRDFHGPVLYFDNLEYCSRTAYLVFVQASQKAATT